MTDEGQDSRRCGKRKEFHRQERRGVTVQGQNDSYGCGLGKELHRQEVQGVTDEGKDDIRLVQGRERVPQRGGAGVPHEGQDAIRWCRVPTRPRRHEAQQGAWPPTTGTLWPARRHNTGGVN